MANDALGQLKIALNLDATDFKKNISQAQQSLKVANEQFKANTAGINKAEASLEELGVQYKSLENVLKNQVVVTQKVKDSFDKATQTAKKNREEANQLKSNWEQAKQTFGETSDEAQKLKIEFEKANTVANRSEAAAGKLEVQYLKNVTAMKKTEAQLNDTKKAMDNYGKEAEEAADETKKVGDSAGGLKGAFRGLAGIIASAFAIDAIVGFGKQILQVTAEIQALNSQYEQVMGDMKASTDKYLNEMGAKWNKHPNELKSAYLQYVAILKAKGVAEEEAHELAKDALERTVDANAFANESMQETTGRFMAMFKGEYDSLDTAMVNLSATMLDTKAHDQYGKKFAELTVAQQEQLKMQEAIRQHTSAGVFGQGEREADSYQNNLAMLKNTWTELQAVMGASLLEKVNGALQKLTSYLANVDVDKINESFGKFSSTIKTKIEPVMKFLSKAFSSLIDTLTDVFSDMAKAFGETSNGADYFQEIVAFAFNYVGAAIGLFAKVLSGILKIVKPILVALAKIFGDVFGQIKKFWDENGSSILKGVKVFTSTFKVLFDGLKAVLLPIVTGMMSVMGTTIKTAINTITNIIKFFVSLFKGDFNGMKSAIVNIVTGMMNGIKGLFSGLWNMVKGAISGFISSVKSAFSGMSLASIMKTVLSKLTGVFGGLWGMVSKPISNFIKSLMDKFKGINLFSIGKDIINGLKKGIEEKFESVKQALTGWASKLPQWMKDKLGIKSPSRVFATQVGAHIPTGIVMGMEKTFPQLKRATEKMALSMVPNLSGINPNLPVSSIQGISGTNSTTNNTTNFSPNIVINGYNDPLQVALQNQRMLRRYSFQGGIGR